MLTLFHPADGRVRVEGVTTCPNAVLHPWLKRELSEILAGAARAAADGRGVARRRGSAGSRGCRCKPTLPAELPPLRVLLVLDNLTGHKTPEFVLWLFAHGVMPLYTPLGGSLAEHGGEHPADPEAAGAGRPAPGDARSRSSAWFEAVAGHWNEDPTPFEWGGKRKRRRGAPAGAPPPRRAAPARSPASPVAAVGRQDYGHAQGK